MSNKHNWKFDEIRRSLGWTVGDWSVFKQGSPFKHLARENTQNTLDATKDTSKPAHIKFEVKRDEKFSNIIPNYEKTLMDIKLIHQQSLMNLFHIEPSFYPILVREFLGL